MFFSHELAVHILCYLTYSILGKWFLKLVNKNKICRKMGCFILGLNREIHLKYSLSETIELI